MSKPPLLGLTLHKPWPVLIAKGIKKIENRKWSPEPRLQPGEWFAIHVGKTYDPTCTPLATKLGVSLDTFLGDPPSNTTSAIVAVARYAGLVTAFDDPWFFGPCGWILDRVVEIEPVPCKGAQSLWLVPVAIADRVREAFKRAESAKANG